MSLKDKIIPERLPKHVAIIMDGNGRWAKKQGLRRVFGHQKGVNAVREATEAAADLGIKYLTLYAFSTENWNRPVEEVNALMRLLVSTINKELPTLNKNKIRLQAIGELGNLPSDCYAQLMDAIEKTKDHANMTLVLALSYSSRWELSRAVKNIAKDVSDGKLVSDDISDDLISSYLETKDYPDPELLIRTSGEFRISNFLLWQIAYSELFFSPTLWPDFNRETLYEALIDYQSRERRFGKISEQLKK